MDIRIFKYALEVDDDQTVVLPQGAEILDVQVQHERPQLWALVDTDMPDRRWQITTIGTGHPIDPVRVQVTKRHHVGTYQLMGGDLVFHVFARQELA